MTSEEKKLIFDYLGWDYPCPYTSTCVEKADEICRHCPFNTHHMDGNEMRKAVKIMEEKDDFKNYIAFAGLNHRDIYGKKFRPIEVIASLFSYISENFFPLLAEALKQGVIK